MPVLPGIFFALLDNEINTIRFENFCLDLYSKAEGIQIVPTSQTWDLGRDGRTISINGREISAVLCATIEKEIEAKVEEDIRRLSKTTPTRAIVYCSSQKLSEAGCSKIEQNIRDLYPSVDSVRVLGQIQLYSLAERYEEVLRRHYRAEIENAEDAIRHPTASSSAEEIGLRLALFTQVGEDAQLLRKNISNRLILDSLLDETPKTPNKLASDISQQLRLPRSVSVNYINELLDDMEKYGLVYFKDTSVQLTAAGTEAAREIPLEASAKLLEGRVAIRSAIKELSGHTLTDDQFSRLWNTFQDGLSELFYNHGIVIVCMVRAVISEEEPSHYSSTGITLIEGFADRVVEVFTDTMQRLDIRQAIIDMFTMKYSVAFDWLTQICGVFVMMCSIGLESLSSRQITQVISNFHLVPDSDIVISLLCVGEDNHDDVERILSNWKKIGGKLLTAILVLEEVAYHAWISEYDYLAVEHQLVKIPDEKAQYLIGNAFVRAFKKEAGEITARKSWHKYISEYRGCSDMDYTRIQAILREDCGFNQLPTAADKEYKAFANEVSDFLCLDASKDSECEVEDLDYRIKHKFRRDGVLMASVLSAREVRHSTGERGSISILSSARLLKQVSDKFNSRIGEPEAVVSLAAVGFLLTLMPQVSMGLSSLRAVLFDPSLYVKLTKFQRYAYRIIQLSEEYDVPFSRRATMQRELQYVLFREASARGVPVSKLKERVIECKDPEYSTDILASILDRMAVVPNTRKERDMLKREIEKMRSEIEITEKLQKVEKRTTMKTLSRKASMKVVRREKRDK